MSKTMTQSEVEERLNGLSEEQAKSVACALIGHSRIQKTFFGYFYCARCGEQVGDSLGSTYDTRDIVIVGHNCDVCQKNYAQFDWRDKFMAPDPFKSEEDAR